MGVADGGEDGLVAEVFLHFEQVDACFDHMGGKGVPQRMWRNLFFRPLLATTWRRVAATPPRSSGVVAHALPSMPPARLGNSNTGLRCTCQKLRSSLCVALGRGTKRSLLRMCTRPRAPSMSPTFK